MDLFRRVKMQNNQLNGMKVAVLIADGFEQVEMTEPKKALENAGAIVKLISPNPHKVQGVQNDNKMDSFTVDVPLDHANANEYDALVLPGGVINPDQLRLSSRAIEFIKQMVYANKPVAAICHGPWTLINAQAVKGHTVTSWPSIKIDLMNAGAHWVDQPVVRDKNIVTSRKPDDLPHFNKAMIELFAEHHHKS